MKDIVLSAASRPLGLLAHALFVRRTLKRIFNHCRDALTTLGDIA